MRKFKPYGLIALLLASIAFPIAFPSPAITTIAFFTLLYAAAATAWNIFAGYTGYIALGHAAYVGIGSYAMAIFCKDWNLQGGYLPFVLIPLAGIVAALVSIPMGWIALRTRKHTFVVVTIAMFFVFQLMAFNLRGLTNGSVGMTLPIPTDWSGAFFNFPFYYVALAILFVALGHSWWIRHSKYGLGLLAIRDDEERARGLGVKTGQFKLTAFVISAFYVGMVGALHAYFIESLYPAFAFDPLFDLVIALMCFLGGLGTLSGPILGAIILEPTQQYFTMRFSQNGYYLIIYGAMFLAIILFLPDGILPTLSRWLAKRQSSGTVRDGEDSDSVQVQAPSPNAEGVTR
ncbi:MAG TPA: branched-chain amino acid ABC transporter permease [Spirochaetia bacterium]|nr:branched-chain amino acid ABC transporter permease [Spirochaetia bacterium]